MVALGLHLPPDLVRPRVRPPRRRGALRHRRRRDRDLDIRHLHPLALRAGDTFEALVIDAQAG
ncbi:hypothetical protein ACU686_12420 [Yinghuangia aomiensis]